MPLGTEQIIEIRKSDGHKTLSSGGYDGEIETPVERNSNENILNSVSQSKMLVG